MHWKILNSKIAFTNKFFQIHKDKCLRPDGKIVDPYYVIDRPEVAVIIAFTSQKKLILIKQYRHPVKSVDFELPAGYLENHETHILKAAKRELLEETGYSVTKLKKIQTVFSSAGLMNNRVNFFIGFDAQKTHDQNLDEAEDITVHPVTFKKALEMLKKGQIKDMAAVTGILLAQEYLKKLS